MNENNNQNLEQNQFNNSVDSTSDISSTGVVEEVNFSYSEQSQSADLNKSGEDGGIVSGEVENHAIVSGLMMEEVSANNEDFDLDKVDTSDNSIFNQVKEDEVVVSSLKEGHEEDGEKKGFPYALVIGFVVLIICVLFIDNIVNFIEEVVLDKDEPVEEVASENK
jgi:hypothetical protein